MSLQSSYTGLYPGSCRMAEETSGNPTPLRMTGVTLQSRWRAAHGLVGGSGGVSRDGRGQPRAEGRVQPFCSQPSQPTQPHTPKPHDLTTRGGPVLQLRALGLGIYAFSPELRSLGSHTAGLGIHA